MNLINMQIAEILKKKVRHGAAESSPRQNTKTKMSTQKECKGDDTRNFLLLK